MGPATGSYWRGDHATSTADVQNAFLFSGVYELPFGRGKRYLDKGPVSYILGNWEWSSILGSYGGQPVNVVLGFDSASTGRANAQRPDLVGDPNSGDPTRLLPVPSRARSLCNSAMQDGISFVDRA